MNDYVQPQPDPQMAVTRPSRVEADPNERYQPVRAAAPRPAQSNAGWPEERPKPIKVEFGPHPIEAPKRKRKKLGAGCLVPLLIVAGLLLVYFLAPFRTNVLLLGIDRAADGSYTGRSDTNILISVIPLKPVVNMLSIPRDLWVTIPGVGEQRINTANFFAEAAQPGSGPQAAIDTIRQNFGVDVKYYARVRFDSFTEIVDAMGGVTVHLSKATAGYDAGTYTLDGTQALAFARNRTGTDDFFRMDQGQILLKAAMAQMLSPASWPKLPAVMAALVKAVDTNIPVWQWPRLGLALLRAGSNGIDNRTLDRDMVTPWTTDQGAQVLLPNWDAINPVLMEMFGQ
jgi:LCP family protein required for cell wall assembly